MIKFNEKKIRDFFPDFIQKIFFLLIIETFHFLYFLNEIVFSFFFNLISFFFQLNFFFFKDFQLIDFILRFTNQISQLHNEFNYITKMK